MQDPVAAVHLGAWDFLLNPIDNFAIFTHAPDYCLEVVRIFSHHPFRTIVSAFLDLSIPETPARNSGNQYHHSIFNHIPHLCI
jgi:hypothetical protein